MLMANEGLPVAGWQQPAGITKLRVCDPSGLLPTTICPAIVEDIFLNGQEPLALDDLYQSLQVNRETNRLATAFTPLEMIDTKTYLIVPQDAKGWAQSAGLPQPPTDYDLIQTAPENPDATITSPQMSACLRGTITIGGTARSSQFSGYRVEVGQGINPQTWTLVSPSGDKPISDGILATWNTAGLDGLYIIRLMVLNNDGTFDSDTLLVTIDNTPQLPALFIQQMGSNRTVQITFCCRQRLMMKPACRV